MHRDRHRHGRSARSDRGRRRRAHPQPPQPPQRILRGDAQCVGTRAGRRRARRRRRMRRVDRRGRGILRRRRRQGDGRRRAIAEGDGAAPPSYRRDRAPAAAQSTPDGRPALGDAQADDRRHPGPAAGAGLSLALACDLRYAVAGAVLTTAFARVGFAGDYGGTWFLTRLVGSGKARELYYFSERMSCGGGGAARHRQRRVRTGRSFEQEVERPSSTARPHGPRVAYRYMKENLNRAVLGELGECLDMEAAHHIHTGRTEDHREARGPSSRSASRNSGAVESRLVDEPLVRRRNNVSAPGPGRLVEMIDSRVAAVQRDLPELQQDRCGRRVDPMAHERHLDHRLLLSGMRDQPGCVGMVELRQRHQVDRLHLTGVRLQLAALIATTRPPASRRSRTESDSRQASRAHPSAASAQADFFGRFSAGCVGRRFLVIARPPGSAHWPAWERSELAAGGARSRPRRAHRRRGRPRPRPPT